VRSGIERRETRERLSSTVFIRQRDTGADAVGFSAILTAEGHVQGPRETHVEVPIEIGLNPVNSAEGAFVLASIIDISERKRSEEVLRKSEERLHTIIENLSEGLVLADLDGQLIHWNQTGLNMLGFSNMEEALLKLPQFQEILELSTPDGTIVKLEDWPLARIIDGEHLVDYELCLRRLDKDWKRVFSYGGTIVSEPNGQSLAFVTFTDITESKQAEENLRRSQEQLAGIKAGANQVSVITSSAEREAASRGGPNCKRKLL